jgi:hypothetical protein
MFPKRDGWDSFGNEVANDVAINIPQANGVALGANAKVSV